MAILGQPMLFLLYSLCSSQLQQCTSLSLYKYIHMYKSFVCVCVIFDFMFSCTCLKTVVLFCDYSIGCVVLYTGQQRFHSSTTSTLEYVVHQADITVVQLRNASDYLASAKQLGVDQVYLPANVQTDIDQIGGKINSSANTLAEKTVENSKDIRDLLDSM